jgi:hypothetical protein
MFEMEPDSKKDIQFENSVLFLSHHFCTSFKSWITSVDEIFDIIHTYMKSNPVQANGQLEED